MAQVTLPKSWAESSPYDDLLPSDLNDNFEAIRDAVNAIEADQLSSSCVTEAKIASGAVTNTKIGTAAVDTSNLAAEAVENAKVKDGDIGGDKLDVFDSGDRTVTAGSTITVAHGLTDDGGAARTPSVFCGPWTKETGIGADYYNSDENVTWDWDDTNVYIENKNGTGSLTVKFICF